MSPVHADRLLATVTADIDRLTPGAVSDLPPTALDDRDLQVPGFARQLRALRFELARQRDYTTIGALLQRLAQRAHHIGDPELAALTYLLRRHHRWVTGQFDTIDDLLNYSHAQPISSQWAALDDLYSAFYLNTSACYPTAMNRLQRVEHTSTTTKRAAEFWIGMDLAHICAAWRFWNRNEYADYRQLSTDTALAEDLCNGRAHAAQSTVQLLLAAGVFYLNRRNYRLAQRYLNAGSDAVTARLAPRLQPRIASALALTCHHQGQHRAAAAHHHRATAGLAEHAGPAGWQLRVVGYRLLTGEHTSALDLTRRIRIETQEKKELAYSIWAEIYELDLLGKLGSGSTHELFTLADSHTMSRACEYIIEHRSHAVTG